MKTIALVEDNPDNMLLLRVLLKGHFVLHEYENGPEAARGIVERPPDLVLMDISLPEMDGVEVMKHIRTHKTLDSLPIVALTAHAMVGDREKYLAEGFDFYIPKPILDEDQLLGPISRFLD
ncbi:MAG: response regulator [Gammaproteobacteria bacterium]|nr:response regulator [Gammaproteobacteria bacterium]